MTTPQCLLFVDVSFLGTTHKNVNFIAGDSVSETYRRWMEAFRARNSPQRSASLHLSLLDPQGSVLLPGVGEGKDAEGTKMPADVDSVHIFSSSTAEPARCVLCALGCPRKLFGFHPAKYEPMYETANLEVDLEELQQDLEPAPAQQRKQQRKPKKKKKASRVGTAPKQQAALDVSPVNSCPSPVSLSNGLELDGCWKEAAQKMRAEYEREEAVGLSLPLQSQGSSVSCEEVSPFCLPPTKGIELVVSPRSEAEEGSAISAESLSPRSSGRPGALSKEWGVESFEEMFKGEEVEVEEDMPELRTMIEGLAGVVKEIMASVRATNESVLQLSSTVSALVDDRSCMEEAAEGIKEACREMRRQNEISSQLVKLVEKVGRKRSK